MAIIDKIQVGNTTYNISGTAEPSKCKTMTFAEAGITAGSTTNLIQSQAITDAISNENITKFIIKPTTLSNSNTIIDLQAATGLIFNAMFMKYGIGKELTFIFCNTLAGSNTTPYYTVRLKGLNNNHTHTFKVPKSGYGSNLSVKLMCTGTSTSSPQVILTEAVYIGDDVLYNSINKIVAVPTTLSGLNVTNIANAFKTTRTVVVSGLTTGACVMLNLNTSTLVSAIKDNLPSGQIHTLVLKNTNTTAGACVTLQYGTKTEDINLPAKSYVAVPLIAIDSYVIPLPHTIMTY